MCHIYIYTRFPGSLCFIWLKFWNLNSGCYPLQVCWMCKASKGSRGDLENCYVNLDPQASWRSTIGQDSPWQHQPEYSKLIGFDPLMISIDPMHCWHLGTGRDPSFVNLSNFWTHNLLFDIYVLQF